jgi:hypothetical protein
MLVVAVVLLMKELVVLVELAVAVAEVAELLVVEHQAQLILEVAVVEMVIILILLVLAVLE